MPRSRITKRLVDSLKPNGREFFVWDRTLLGFGVRVQASGVVVFDVLRTEGRDMRRLPLWRRKVALGRLAAEHGVTVIDSIAGQGRALFKAVCNADLEGIVAKCRSDPYGPGATWFKIRNPSYTQKEGRGDLFEKRKVPRRRLPVERIDKGEASIVSFAE